MSIEKKDDKCWRIIEELAYLKRDIKYSENLKVKWKNKQKISFWNTTMDSDIPDLALIHCLVRKLLIEKGRDFSLENHLEFFDFVKACDKVKRDKLFEILQSEYIACLLLKTQRNLLWKRNKININNKLSDNQKINHGVRQDCRLSPTLFKICLKEIMVQWTQNYTIGIISDTTKQ